MKRAFRLLVAGSLSAVVSVNVLAFMQARAMTCFVEDGERTARPEQLSLLERVSVILSGVNIPRPRSLSTPANLLLATNRAVITILDDDFRFATIAVVGRDVVLRFNTLAGQSNRVEWTGELAPASVWTPVAGATNVPGNGSVVQIIELDGGTQPQRFYRIRRLP
jgi:hypothetical protein